MILTIDPEYDIGQTVYLKTDPDQYPRLVEAYVVTERTTMYKLAHIANSSQHYDFEISARKNFHV
jgi:hypothetical protein